MVDLAMSIFEFLTKFLIFWHPWDPWICIRSVCWKWNLKQIEAIPPNVKSGQVWRHAKSFYEYFVYMLICAFQKLRAPPNAMRKSSQLDWVSRKVGSGFARLLHPITTVFTCRVAFFWVFSGSLLLQLVGAAWVLSCSAVVTLLCSWHAPHRTRSYHSDEIITTDSVSIDSRYR